MKTIKFRGKRVDNGDLIYGDIAHTEIGILMKGFEVDPESVAQFVGYDKNGAEVYEGDTVIRYDDEEEFVECPENGKLCTVIFDTQVIPDLNDYYCLIKEAVK